MPEWLYAKMVAGYTPMVPTLGTMSTIGAALALMFGWIALTVARRRQQSGG